MTIAEYASSFFRPSARTLPVSGRRIGLGSLDPLKEWRSPKKTSDPAQLMEVSEDTSKSYPFPVWSGLLTRKHRMVMGVAIWTFLWFLDRVTAEKDGWGIVLGRKPVKDREIAQCLGVHENSVRTDRKKLLEGHYIECKRTPYGFVYRVRNSRKFGIWGKKRITGNCDSRVTENCQSRRGDSQKAISPESQETVETKKTMQVDHAVKPTPPEGEFEAFWKEYPRKDDKKAAERAWQKVLAAEVPRILAAVRVWKQTNQWLKESGQFIPFAAKFLNQERWKDPQPGQTGQPESTPVRIPTVRDIQPKDR